MTLLDVQHVQKVYQTRFGAAEVTALKDINFSIEEGEYVAVMGESGSGKTTLLNILATLDRPTGGSVLLNGEDIQKISSKVLTEFRRDHLGFVFQDFNLLETLSVYDNIVLPLVLARRPIAEMEQKVQERVLTVAKKTSASMEDDSGAKASMNEDEMKDYVELVIKELRSK